MHSASDAEQLSRLIAEAFSTRDNTHRQSATDTSGGCVGSSRWLRRWQLLRTKPSQDTHWRLRSRTSFFKLFQISLLQQCLFRLPCMGLKKMCARGRDNKKARCDNVFVASLFIHFFILNVARWIALISLLQQCLFHLPRMGRRKMCARGRDNKKVRSDNKCRPTWCVSLVLYLECGEKNCAVVFRCMPHAFSSPLVYAAMFIHILITITMIV